MTITRRWQSGAEVNGLSSHAVEFDRVVADASFKTSGTYSKTGSYSYRLINGGGNPTYGEVDISSTAEIRIGAHLKGVAATAKTDKVPLISWTQGSLAIDTSGNLHILVNGVTKESGGSLPDDGSWYQFGIVIEKHGSAGWITVYQDGVSIMSFVGNSGSLNIIDVQFGDTSTYGINGSVYYDDMYIDDTTGEDDTAPPDYRFAYIRPNGIGASVGFSPEPDTADNYENVDDPTVHDSDATYNEATADQQMDFHNMTAHSLASGWACTAVIPVAIAKKSDAGIASKLSLVVRSGTTNGQGAARTLTTSYTAVSHRFEDCPGGAGWTQSQINSLQAGYKARGTF